MPQISRFYGIEQSSKIDYTLLCIKDYALEGINYSLLQD